MRHTMGSIILILFSLSVIGQKGESEIQIAPFVIIDWYPEFSFKYGGRASTDRLKMRGISPGLYISYKHALKNKANIIVGMGYYKYSFNSLSRINSVFGTSDTRPIEYPSTIQVFYNSDNYHYNTISFNIGAEKLFKIKKGFQLNVGVNMSNFFAFQQVFKLTYDNVIYRKNNKNLFAQSFFLNAAIEKKMGKLKIGPQLIIPLFDMWRKDDAFLENNSEKRNKWLGGVGLGIQINYPLTKK